MVSEEIVRAAAVAGLVEQAERQWRWLRGVQRRQAELERSLEPIRELRRSCDRLQAVLGR